MGFKEFFHYETAQIVRIRNVRVSLIYHFAQIIIVAYVVGYGLIYKKAYQATGEVVGTADIKVKGVGYVNQTLPWNGPSNDTCIGNSCFHIYDAYDLVLPPLEVDAVFVTTNMWVTKKQTRGVCQSYLKDNKCNATDANSCVSLKGTQNGRQTGTPGSCRTNYTDPLQLWKDIVPKGSFCDVYAWCPTELEITDKSIINNFGIQGVREFTVFVRMNVNYPDFGYTIDNTAGQNTTTEFVNLWTLEQMVNLSNWNWTSVQNQGITLAMNAVWNCNFDTALSNCVPAIQFVRLDDPMSQLSSGFNFRSAEYLPPITRQLTKHYGVRLLVLISGTGAKFDWAALLTAIGAGIGLLSVATLIADFIATNILQNKGIYRQAKFLEVEVLDEDEKRKQSRAEGGPYLPPSHHQSDDASTLDVDDHEDEGKVESWGIAKYPTKQ